MPEKGGGGGVGWGGKGPKLSCLLRPRILENFQKGEFMYVAHLFTFLQIYRVGIHRANFADFYIGLHPNCY
jgi:hypothetical protein